ncbi:MAG: glycine--tRNA ligase subunit beta [Methylophilaceae bacterium]|nr:glycine--tRNA ligase subunit beta [Methylophilaceae bacterium]
MRMASLLVELLVEELPPKALKKLGEAFASSLAESLHAQGLAAPDSTVTPYATPRRLAVHISKVASQAADKPLRQKLMPVSVGLDANGQPTPALLKKLATLGVDATALSNLRREQEGKTEMLYLDSLVTGISLAEGLQKALEETLSKLPIPKVMSYQLADGWSTVHFVRPAHGLVALHGNEIVPVHVLGLVSSNLTQGHRFEARKHPIMLQDADHYATQLESEGAVIASFEARRTEIARQLEQAAARAGSGLKPVKDDALLDEVTALVERPNVLLGQFDAHFLEVPQECLILTMKIHQKYFPLLDAHGKLTNRFLLVSNVHPADPSAIIAGNERVVRPRLADAKFFYDQDRKKPLESRIAELDRVVYHNRLGSQGERVRRLCTIAHTVGHALGGEHLARQAEQAARLAKADLVTEMVGEFPELQGVMGRYYAQHDGLGNDIAIAIEDHYKPRFAGDELPRNNIGLAVALADKLETLVGLFGIGEKPTGEKDPYALRRHALGITRILTEKQLPLRLDVLLSEVVGTFGSRIENPTAALTDFIYERLAGSLREQGYRAQEIDAVLALRPQRLAEIKGRLEAVRAFSTMPESESLSAANKRIRNILKKAGDEALPEPDIALFAEEAEKALFFAMHAIIPEVRSLLANEDYTDALAKLATLRTAVDRFFDQVMVMTDEPLLRRNRLALLNALADLMNGVADISRLAA